MQATRENSSRDLGNRLVAFTSRWSTRFARVLLLFVGLQLPLAILTKIWIDRWHHSLRIQAFYSLTITVPFFVSACLLFLVVKVMERKRKYLLVLGIKVVLTATAIAPVFVDHLRNAVHSIPSDYLDGWGVLIGTIVWLSSTTLIAVVFGVKRVPTIGASE